MSRNGSDEVGVDGDGMEAAVDGERRGMGGDVSVMHYLLESRIDLFCYLLEVESRVVGRGFVGVLDVK